MRISIRQGCAMCSLLGKIDLTKHPSPQDHEYLSVFWVKFSRSDPTKLYYMFCELGSRQAYHYLVLVRGELNTAKLVLHKTRGLMEEKG